jgi:hypothetical protein
MSLITWTRTAPDPTERLRADPHQDRRRRPSEQMKKRYDKLTDG